MADSVKIVFDAIDNTSRGVNSVQQGLKKIQASLLAVVAGATATVVAVKKMSDMFTDYADQVEAVSRVTGQSAEESSKLIQVADDLFISYEALSQAMKGAVKAGIEPNIESLAELSDQYLALAPGLERSTFLLDKFGKSGLEMGKMLEKGGDAIRNMAGKVPEGLIIDDADIQKARELKEAWDNIGDAAQSFGLSIAGTAAPAITDMLNALTNGFSAWEGILKRSEVKEFFWDVAESATSAMNFLLSNLSGGLLNIGIKRPEDYKLDIPTKIKTKIILAPDGEIDTSPIDDAMNEVQAKNELDFIMSFQANFDSFDQTRDELLAKMEETRDKILAIREEMAGGTMTESEGADAITDLQGEITDLSGQLNDNRAKWEQWQKQTAFSLISTRMLAQGVDLGAILKMGEDFGVIDPEVVAQAQAMMDAVTNVDPGNLGTAVEDIKYLVSQDGRTIKIYVEQTTTTVGGGSMPTPTGMTVASSGGDTFINYGPQYFFGNTIDDVLAEWR